MFSCLTRYFLNMSLACCMLVIAILGTASTQTFSMGQCDSNIQTLNDFEVSKYLGKWYEIKRSFNAREEHTKCFNILIKLQEDSHLESVGNFAFTNESAKLQTMLFVGKPTNVSRGVWEFTPGFISEVQPILILDTDYENYAVEYTCMDAYKGKLEFLWIISRTPKMDDTIFAKVEKFVKSRNINLDLISEVHDCEWLNNVS